MQQTKISCSRTLEGQEKMCRPFLRKDKYPLIVQFLTNEAMPVSLKTLAYQVEIKKFYMP